MKKDTKKIKKVVGIVLNVLLWVFLAFAVSVTVLVLASSKSEDQIANINGNSIISIQSGSMEPTINTGDMIIIHLLTADEKKQCKVGQIITFYADLNGDNQDELNTHRIVAINENGSYVTKGDNKETNPVNDKNPVYSTKVIGVFDEENGTRIAHVGTFLSFLQSSTGFMVCIVVPLILFFLYELYCFIMVLVHMKAKSALSAEDKEDIKRKAIEEYLREQAREAQKNGTAAPAEAPKADETKPDETKPEETTPEEKK